MNHIKLRKPDASTSSKTNCDLPIGNAWGKHLILDMKNCSKASITNKNTIKQFCDELVSEIKMKPYGKPIIKHFATHSPGSSGFSLVQLIETSNICGHFAEMSGDAYIDIFSCKDFSEKVAIKICKKYFSPESIKNTTLYRGVSR